MLKTIRFLTLSSLIAMSFACATAPVDSGETQAKSQIEQVLVQKKDEFQKCYRDQLIPGKPNPTGRVLTTFELDKTGKVTKALIQETTLKNTKIETCLLEVIRKTTFHAPKEGTIVKVNYPFVFSSPSQAAPQP